MYTGTIAGVVIGEAYTGLRYRVPLGEPDIRRRRRIALLVGLHVVSELAH
ncbi:hypothetical protein [Actinopolymorpha pittospori]|uniref:Uncharacterized protein n=1 Tax=Actinopolymorpha pittospori TaxID=648752 RepID=A0A927N5Q8_9ACTN|nr:hypothetical protein [Actinopolymorpha pittospori]MBE1612629.1 hypothetical protein [Actinopolymorpha pittospori]